MQWTSSRTRLASVYKLLYFLLLLILGTAGEPSFPAKKSKTASTYAVVTLVTGTNSGYVSGAIALGQSIKNIGSKLHRVVMVTPEVEESSRKHLSTLYEVIEVQHIYCNHKLDASITPEKFDLQGEKYKAGIKRWQSTCTKFAAWSLTQFERVIFMDSDMLVVGEIDDALHGFSNASFLAAPETFPPDTFNSGFMVLNPSLATLNELLAVNEKVGSAEGGDQGVLNNGFCPNWYTASDIDTKCGRLPWIFNVNAANFDNYNTLRKMAGEIDSDFFLKYVLSVCLRTKATLSDSLRERW
jgi:hypothetical protein